MLYVPATPSTNGPFLLLGSAGLTSLVVRLVVAIALPVVENSLSTVVLSGVFHFNRARHGKARKLPFRSLTMGCDS